MRLSQIASVGLSVALCAWSAGCAGHSGSTAKRPTYSISIKVAEQLKKIGELARDKKWDEALAAIDREAEKKYLNPYEHAALFAARAGIHAATNKIDEAAKDLEQAVALDAMPEEQQRDTLYGLAEAYFTLERFNDAANTFTKFLELAKNPEPNQYYLIAHTFALAKRFKEALPIAEKALAGVKDPPKEEWLYLMVTLHYELKQDKECIPFLVQLTQRFPKRDYWLQLTATYQALEQHDKALATMAAAYEKGALTESKDLTNLAKMYLQQGAPLKGAAVLDKALKEGKVEKSPENYEILATCWVLGRDIEHGEAALKQAGGGVAGDLYVELGRAEVEKGEWLKARDALASALQKGGLSSPGEAHLLLGVVHYNTKRKDAAIASLGEAKKHPDTAKCAEEWIQLVRSGQKGSASGCATAAGKPKLAAAEGD